jgi:hypothetical protein
LLVARVAHAARHFSAAIVVAVLRVLALAFPDVARLTSLARLRRRLHHCGRCGGWPLRGRHGLHHGRCRRHCLGHHHRRDDATLAALVTLVTLITLMALVSCFALALRHAVALCRHRLLRAGLALRRRRLWQG